MPYAYAFHETMASLLVDMVPLSDDDPLEMTTQREIAYQMAMLYRFAFKTMSTLADREEAGSRNACATAGLKQELWQSNSSYPPRRPRGRSRSGSIAISIYWRTCCTWQARSAS